MTFDTFKEWVALLGLGGIVGTLVALIAKAVLERKTQDHEHRWQEEKERRDRIQETDRATYNQRLTVLVREHLAAYIRSGDWPNSEEDLRRLLAGLSQRTYEHFLDPTVNQAWEILVARSLELAARRLSHRIREADIWEYNQLRTEWEDACKRSFGPLPPTPSLVLRRQDPRDSAPSGT